MWISPILTIGTAARGLAGGASGAVWGAGAAPVVDVVGGSVVVVVSRKAPASSVGSSSVRAPPGVELTIPTVAPPTTITAVRVAMTSSRSARDSGIRAESQRSGCGRRDGRGGGGVEGTPSSSTAPVIDSDTILPGRIGRVAWATQPRRPGRRHFHLAYRPPAGRRTQER